MEESNLIPYLFQLMVEQAGGIVDFDAKQVLESIKSEKKRVASVAFIDGGTLRVELLDEEEINEN
jgi:hypothetical protein